MLNTTSSRVYVCTAVHNIVVSTNHLSICVQQRMCLCGFYVLSVSAYIYILWSLRVCLFVSEEESFLTILSVFVFLYVLNKYSLQLVWTVWTVHLCYIFYCVVCLRVGKTGYYCLLDAMELLLSLWLNKMARRDLLSIFWLELTMLSTKAHLFARNSLKRLSVCVCVSGKIDCLYVSNSLRFRSFDFFLYFSIRLKLFWCLRYAQRSHFASLVCPYNFPYKFGSCPYKNDMWKFKNLYLLKEFFDRFDVFGKLVGMDMDYTEKKWYTVKKIWWFSI